jgi:hypothetical protein
VVRLKIFGCNMSKKGLILYSQMKKGLFLIVSISCCISCTQSQVNFSEEYKTNNRGKFSFEVPEVQELVHIIFAITKVGIADSNMVDHESLYYKEVMAYFFPFKNESIVLKINDELDGSMFMSGTGKYARLKMDACGFYFEGNSIKQDKMYPQLNWDNKNHLKKYIPALEAFAMKTNFRQFFKDHQSFYENQIALSKKQMPIEKQWKWLEERFPNTYQNYRITFSPLVNGSHSTNRFGKDDFRQTVMFICSPIENSKFSEKVIEGLMTRVVFTEIDHNYVNPVTDLYKKRIDKIFDDREKWTAGKDAANYGSPYSVFNEYMTWGVFTLYVYDNFSVEDFKIINQRTENQLVNSRGFSHFKPFNKVLLELYKNKKPNQSIADLYPAILDWSASH